MREKERRQILNDHYNTLLQMLKPRPNTRRMEKTSILEETITMMNTLIRTNRMLEERNKEMENEIRMLRKEKKQQCSEGKEGGGGQAKTPDVNFNAVSAAAARAGTMEEAAAGAGSAAEAGSSCTIPQRTFNGRSVNIRLPGTETPPSEHLRRRFEDIVVGDGTSDGTYNITNNQDSPTS